MRDGSNPTVGPLFNGNITPIPSHEDNHCDDPRYVATSGPLAEPQLPTGYEPNDLIVMNSTEVTPIFFHRPSVTSTYDSAESIATPLLE